MAPGLPRRNGQKTGQRPAEAQAPVGYTWADYVEALVAEHGTQTAVAWKLVERGLAEDPTSVERALRRLRGRGQRDGGLIGQRLLRVFGVPATVEAQARLVDHEAFDVNRRGDYATALALYRALPTEDVHPFASYRRDAGLAFGLHQQGAREEALRLALRACDHAGDGGYVRLRVMGLLMVARIQGAPEHAKTLDRALAIAKRLNDPELLVRVERAKERALSQHRR
ncbi:hypothetical protein ACLEPN_22385 [Myxococcus sp. 1LA]